MHDSKDSPRPAGKKSSEWSGAPLIAALAALLGRLPALGAYWNQDDWGLLAPPLGIATATETGARWLSRVAYWEAMVPLAGLDPTPYAWSRVLLHAATAAGVARLAQKLGLVGWQPWLAGLVMAAAPLAFTPLYWASGIQDLLATSLATWALVAWCGRGRRSAVLAVVLAMAAVSAKETVAALPIVMVVLACGGPSPRRGVATWSGVLLAAAASLAAAALAFRAFATAGGDPYALGGATSYFGNLLTYGWWLLQPGPTFTPQPTVIMAAIGGVMWLAWVIWAGWSWRRGRRVPAIAAFGALAFLAPLLPLARHQAPDLAYPVEIFGCLALASLVPRRWPRPTMLLIALTIGAVAWGFFGMKIRLERRDPNGLPADSLVRCTAASWQAMRLLDHLPPLDQGLVILQPPLTDTTARMASELGERWVTSSLLYHSLGGTLGPRVTLGPDVPVLWANGLRETPSGALVLLDAGVELVPWGTTAQAMLYQTLTDVGLGNYERARLHLLRAGLLGGETLALIHDPGLMPVTLERVLANKEEFVDYLAAGLREGRSRHEVGGLQTNFFRLLAACTGITEDELRTPTNSNDGTSP